MKTVNAGMIGQALHRYYENYHFLLSNSFVFNWESDFLARSKQKYFVEVEVKISRSDFLRDFDKPKHEVFKSAHACKAFHVQKTGYDNRGDFLFRIEWKELNAWGNYRGRKMKENPDCLYGRKNDVNGYWTNQDVWHLSDRSKDLYAPATGIQFLDLAKYTLPHQFYFCAPLGLLNREEIPSYAGFMEYGDDGFIRLVKRAPYLHKRKMDLWETLAWKFYWLQRYKTKMTPDLENQIKSET